MVGTLGILGAFGALGLSGCGSKTPSAGGQPTAACLKTATAFL